MRNIRWISLTIAAVSSFFVSTAWAQEKVAVMKIDSADGKSDTAATFVFKALQNEVTQSQQYDLDADGSDLSYKEMKTFTGCDDSKEIVSCSEAACGVLETDVLLFGDVSRDNEVKLVRYQCGKGKSEFTAVVTDEASAQTLARRAIVGEFGTIELTTNVSDATVFIDGRKEGNTPETPNTPMIIERPAGAYIISVQKNGYKTRISKISIKSSDSTQLSFDMEVDTSPIIRKGLILSGWTVAGTGVAALISAGVLGSLAQYKYNDDMNSDIRSGNTNPALSLSDQNKRGKNMVLSANVLFGVGGVLAATGVTLLCIGYFYKFNEVSDFALQITPEYQGFTMSWEF